MFHHVSKEMPDENVGFFRWESSMKTIEILGDSPQNQLVLVAPFEAGMKFNWLPWLLDFRGVGGLRKLRIYVLLTW